jgi:Fur family peroxide stress response transcriptional regulator
MDRSPQRIQSRIDELIARCRTAGMNVTPQRVAVYRALLESEDHPTPEMLYRAVSRHMPSLSLATIYKVLETLTGLGLVRSVPVVSDKRRYDANDDAHHHLVCSACGSVSDYYTHDFDELVPRQRMSGFKPLSISVSINGICAACRRKEKREDARH